MKLSNSNPSPDSDLKSFVSTNPQSKFTFDSERGADQSEICRVLENGEKDCRIIKLESKKMFATMQDLGFFCALPMDPSNTHMVCTPIPK